MKRYKFVGDGLGVPGLPHEITEEQAHRLGVQDQLGEALKNGNYEEVKEKRERDAEKSHAGARSAQQQESDK